MEHDPIFTAFLKRQLAEGTKLAQGSDVLDLLPLPAADGPPSRYVAQFTCKSVLRGEGGQPRVAMGQFQIGINFPPDYLRRPPHPAALVTWLGPDNIAHPNVKPPFVCLGNLLPGTRLVDLLFQLYEIITWHNWAPHDCLDGATAAWARRHRELFPVDNRPLMRRKCSVQVEQKEPPK